MGTKMLSEEMVTSESGWANYPTPFKLFYPHDLSKTQFWGVRPRQRN